jgi:hypothetical protein
MGLTGVGDPAGATGTASAATLLSISQSRPLHVEAGSAKFAVGMCERVTELLVLGA